MNNYYDNFEYDEAYESTDEYNEAYEYDVDDEYDEYEDDRGYEVYEYYGYYDYIIHWFRTYNEIFETFGEMVVWDFENEMYIVHHENEEEYDEAEVEAYEDDLLDDISKVLPEGCNVIINEL